MPREHVSSDFAALSFGYGDVVAHKQQRPILAFGHHILGDCGKRCSYGDAR